MLAACVDLFCSKSQLREYIILCGAAIEGIVLCGDIQKLPFSQRAKIILHVQAVCLRRLAVDIIALPPVNTLQLKTSFRVVGQLCLAQRNIPPDPGKRIDLHLIFKAVHSALSFSGIRIPFSF